jgi:hypothetical protein
MIRLKRRKSGAVMNTIHFSRSENKGKIRGSIDENFRVNDASTLEAVSDSMKSSGVESKDSQLHTRTLARMPKAACKCQRPKRDYNFSNMKFDNSLHTGHNFHNKHLDKSLDTDYNFNSEHPDDRPHTDCKFTSDSSLTSIGRDDNSSSLHLSDSAARDPSAGTVLSYQIPAPGHIC